MKAKHILFFIFTLLSTLSLAQEKDYYLKGGYIAGGYDVTEYFNNQAVEGQNQFTLTHDNVNYKFASQSNLDKFKANPSQYMPQYGGWCAYAMGKDGSKAPINPKTFEIRDGKLYLFYNAFTTNTLEKWLKEGAEELKENADKHWDELL